MNYIIRVFESDAHNNTHKRKIQNHSQCHPAISLEETTVHGYPIDKRCMKYRKETGG